MSDTIDNGAGKCPVDLETRSLWGLWGGAGSGNGNETERQQSQQQQVSPSLSPVIPASLEEAARHAQTPHPGQKLALSTHRSESTIPRNNHLPAHQIRAVAGAGHAPETDASVDNNNNNNNNNWVYPSEQQVFNAMKRKGWKNVEEESIPSFLQIHNSVNERSWREVLKWEQKRNANSNSNPNEEEVVELSRFEGRPKDLSPKAWFLSTLGLRDKPFDRHDWYVVRNNRKPASSSSSSNNTAADTDIDGDIAAAAAAVEEKRYVLDFYMVEGSKGETTGLPRVEIDVRPALDSPSAVLQRGVGVLRELFPGIAREYDDRVR